MLTAKEKAARSPYANWLTDARKAFGYSSSAKAAEAITERTGVLGLSTSAMAAYESGARIPHLEHLRAIEAIYGAFPGNVEEAAAQSPDMAAILELLRLQTEELKSAWEAIHYLADTIRESRVAPDEMAEVVVRVMEARERIRGQAAPATSTPSASTERHESDAPQLGQRPRTSRDRDGERSAH